MVKIPSPVVLTVRLVKILLSLVYWKFHNPLYNLCSSQGILRIFHCLFNAKITRNIVRTLPRKLIFLFLKSKLVSKPFCLWFFVGWVFFLNIKREIIFLCHPSPFERQLTISCPGLPIKAAALIPNILFSHWSKFLANVLPEVFNDYGY